MASDYYVTYTKTWWGFYLFRHFNIFIDSSRIHPSIPDVQYERQCWLISSKHTHFVFLNSSSKHTHFVFLISSSKHQHFVFLNSSSTHTHFGCLNHPQTHILYIIYISVTQVSEGWGGGSVGGSWGDGPGGVWVGGWGSSTDRENGAVGGVSQGDPLYSELFKKDKHLLYFSKN